MQTVWYQFYVHMMIGIEITSKYVISTDSCHNESTKTTKSGFLAPTIKDMTPEMDSAPSN